MKATQWLGHMGVGLMRLLARCPLPLLRGMGFVLGHLLYGLAARRRRVGQINLALCFPEASAAQRTQWLKAHFVAFTQAWLDRSWLWHGRASLLHKRLRWVGSVALLDQRQATVIFAPHFVGLDAGWTALCLRHHPPHPTNPDGHLAPKASEAPPLATIYTPQRNPVVDAWMRKGRTRWGSVQVCRREDGLQRIRSVLKQNGFLYLLPDLNHGMEESVFVPFYGRPAATVPSLSRLARVGRARVLPLVTRLTPTGYEIEVGAAWTDYPSDDALADTARMNRELEKSIADLLPQYHWLHQRFKSTPHGEPSPYV